jgi:PIN domain nuclease of toxin-antitoxin system
MVYVIDTHSLIWFLEGSRRLPSKAKALLLDDNHFKVIPSIVLAEMFYLYSKHRIVTHVKRASEMIQASRNCIVYPLDENVIEKLSPELDIHDGIICATALVYRDVLGHDVAVITKDETIAEKGLVKTVWS